MLAFVTMFVVTFIVAAVSICLYRSIASWQGFNRTTERRQASKNNAKMAVQRGFIALSKRLRKKATKTRSHPSKGAIKAPWGW